MTFATNNFLPIPTPDPMPLPGPVWLLLTLLLLTFLLHLLAMNLTVGGTLIALVCARQRKRDGFAAQLATSLLQILPTSLAFTITLGVAALLFVQVLYGNLLYASSILIAAFWFAVIPTVMLAYYGLYCAKSRPSKLAPPVVSFLLLLGIGFVYVNNMTLMLSPQRWLSLYRHDASGWNLNWSEPTLAPRYLHMMLGAVAIAGFCIFAAGVWKRSTDYGQWMLRQGSRWFVAPTIVNYVVGMWFLMALPRPVLIDLFTSGPLAAILIGMGMLLPLAAVVHVVLAARTEKTRLHARLAVVTTLLTMIVMVVLRQVVRTAYVDPFLRLRELPVQPQWSVIAIFLLLFVAGLATDYAMLSRLWRGATSQ